VGVYNNLGVIGNAFMEHKPHIAFNLLEEFHGYPLYDQHVVSYLELMKQPYTGCNPRGLTICRDKALSKMVLAYHRIHVPAFAVFHMNRKVKRVEAAEVSAAGEINQRRRLSGHRARINRERR
jgi:D-alanine-D-alanine ligase